MMLLPALLQAQVTQQVTTQSPTSVSFAQLVATVSIVVGLCTIGTVLYRIGGHATDLKNTKDTLGADMKRLGGKVDEGFAAVNERLDRTEAAVSRRDEGANTRLNEWTGWRKELDGRVGNVEETAERAIKTAHNARDVAQATVAQIGVMDQRLKPIEDVVRLRKGEL